jgi:tryptophan 2,3-dioxygenase
MNSPSVPSGTPGTDYTTYLRIDDLLDLQHPLSEGAHDEMLFIVIHQVYELWFKLILHELDRACEELLAGRPQGAVPPLVRATRVDELLVAQLRVLETMSPDGFIAFRDPLKPASGLQSAQFRAIEVLGGMRDDSHLQNEELTQQDRDSLRHRFARPTLFEALCASLRSAGLDAPDGDDEASRRRRFNALASLYREHSDPLRAALHQVCELMLDHDETVIRWRFQHLFMAAREIGSRTGTGGTAGVEYLRTTLDRRFFPELWEVRNRL